MRIKAEDFKLMIQIFLALLTLEVAFRLFTVGLAKGPFLLPEILIITLLSAASAGALTVLRALLRGKAGSVIFSLLVIFISLMFAAQDVYYFIFETFFTFYSMANGAQVVEFQDVIWNGIFNEILPIIFFLAVGALIIYLGVFRFAGKRKEEMPAGRGRNMLCILLVTAITLGGGFGIAFVKSDDPASPYQRLYGVNEIKEMVKSFGLTAGMGIDLSRLVFGFEPKVKEEAVAVDTEPKKDANVIASLDFAELAEKETDETLKTMHSHFSNVVPTMKNDKTGIFEGKNLIFITAESFTDFAVDPVHTPTLYKLQTEGYTFSNFYNPIWGVSTLDGEYVNLQGLIPKPGVWSMKASAHNALPFTLGHQFGKLGYVTRAYHDHSVYYYDRNISHPNLGYDFKGQDDGYSFEKTWPESDVEMIEETAADYLTPGEDGSVEPFHVYYLTVSGHLNYNFSGNYIAAKNKSLTDDMDMSEACRAYMAGEIELDRAVALLIEKLDEAGQLDNTVIALAGDHYPYGLSEEEISEFKGHETDTEYEMYKSTFLLWTPNMEPERVDKICCNLDILPTLSNMFGLEYDSRLLMGRDIFSTAAGMVIFKDKDWISERGTRKALLKEAETSEEARAYVAEMDETAAQRFNYSTLILDTDYYSHLAPEQE